MTQPTTRTIKAHELLPGDVVVNETTGERMYAAFDVDQGAEVTSIWTALRDQEAGQPDHLTLDRDRDVTILRTTGDQRAVNRQATTPARIGAGSVVHLLAGDFTPQDVRHAGIEVDTYCGARRRVGSRSMMLPAVTIEPSGQSTCARCDKTAARRATWAD